MYGITDFVSAFITGIVKYYSGYLFDNCGLKYAWTFSIIMAAFAVVAAIAAVKADKKEIVDCYDESRMAS
ncbi:hypothetical protein [Butyrivibrio sp. AE3003]|uniref:hypothetical protein n=1 Tax=Butyrivibrio sp. AE3003 TaxID=1496721 RepID=UPI00047D2188|nr:hypothetical protein [Butyrivibrio sp. AE3003]